jgi:hypothetical protein
VNEQSATTESPSTASYRNIAGLVEYARGKGIVTATKNWIRTLIASGELPHIRCGKAFYVSVRSFDTYLENHARRRRG